MRLVTISACALSAILAAPGTAEIVVGTGAGGMGSIVAPLVNQAADDLSFSTANSSTLDATFFGSIDVFVFANAMGASEYSLGPAARAHLLNFVNNGGVAYLGLDDLQDAASIAADFGFSLGDRNEESNSGLISVISNAISAGPFQPASNFTQSWHARFNGSAPEGGQFLAATAYGNALAYRELGLGKVYIFSDEVPLYGGVADHQNMFNNVLFAAGAPLVPAPSTLVPAMVAGLGLTSRRRARAGA